MKVFEHPYDAFFTAVPMENTGVGDLAYMAYIEGHNPYFFPFSKTRNEHEQHHGCEKEPFHDESY
jgi:hypothetical protein